MLESMTTSRLPTRAESTDVANAILDGTDCIMLSGESAMGRYPEDAVAMLARIATYSEAHKPRTQRDQITAIANRRLPDSAPEAIGELIEHALDLVPFAAVFVPTRSGTTARMISRFNPPVWVIAVSEDAAVCQGLAFTYGVHAVHVEKYPGNWSDFARTWLAERQIKGRMAMLVTGPHDRDLDANHQIQFIHLGTGDGQPEAEFPNGLSQSG
jgi:pyruvate kinase